jgi:transposase
VRFARVWQEMLGVERTVVEGVVFDEEAGVIVASVRPGKGGTRRCGRCGRRCPWEDRGEGRRRWRTLDLGSVPAYLEADAPRVRCAEHGVIVAQVPWARHKARHTTAFEDQCVRHEAPLNRVGGRDPPPGCRSSLVKLGAA